MLCRPAPTPQHAHAVWLASLLLVFFSGCVRGVCEGWVFLARDTGYEIQPSCVSASRAAALLPDRQQTKRILPSVKTRSMCTSYTTPEVFAGSYKEHTLGGLVASMYCTLVPVLWERVAGQNVCLFQVCQGAHFNTGAHKRVSWIRLGRSTSPNYIKSMDLPRKWSRREGTREKSC